VQAGSVQMNGRRGSPSLPIVGVQAWPPVQSESMLHRRGLPTEVPGGTQNPSSSPIAAHHDPAPQSELTRQGATQ